MPPRVERLRPLLPVESPHLLHIDFLPEKGKEPLALHDSDTLTRQTGTIVAVHKNKRDGADTQSADFGRVSAGLGLADHGEATAPLSNSANLRSQTMPPPRVAVVLSAIVIFLVGASASPAVAQNNCAPFSGTVYGALYPDAPEAPPTWHAVGTFTIGKGVYRAIIGVSTRIPPTSAGPGVMQGGEQWTFDFGEGDTVQLNTDFVAEHLTDPTGVFHVTEVGQFANGTGAFKHAVGSLISGGPFGPAVVLPPAVTDLPSSAILFWIAPSHGMICGTNNRNQ